MQKNKKTRTQGTGNEQNTVDSQPVAGLNNLVDGSVNAGNESTAGTLADSRSKSKKNSKTNTLQNNTTASNHAAGVDVNAGGISIDRSLGATNEGSNPGGDASKAGSTGKKKATAKPADGTIAKAAGKAKAAIAGTGSDDNTAVKSTSKKAAPSSAPTLTKIYGQVVSSGSNCFIEKGSVPEGQYQLQTQKGKQDYMSHIASYNQQFVTVLGEFGKKTKSEEKGSTFVVHTIVSHDEIARHAFELSHGAEGSQEDNWLRAENDLLYR